MNVQLIVVGKTDSKQVASIVDEYKARLGHYVRFDIAVVPDLKSTKSLSEEQQKRAEGEAIMRLLNTSDYVVLMDERGEQYSSEEFAAWMEKRMASGCKRLCFIIGGPYGFSPEVYGRADGKISLSRMTFSHQIVRAIFAEQLYRAFTILRGEPYHHR